MKNTPENTTVRISCNTEDSIVDGPGIRLVVFTQGCPHRCPGCHNEGTWDFSGGSDVTAAEIIARLRANPLCDGVTLSGGEPMCRAAALLPVAVAAHALGQTVVTYTGYTFEALLAEGDPARTALLRESDLLVDGPFILAARDLTLRFCGSRNQRVLDVRASLAADRPVLAKI
jgi:anaerobic ribonucleoside-triphosphate reductase activating protein